jgi:hypothetical protein
MKTALFTAAALIALAIPVRAQDSFKTDENGFILNWLVLAPIPLAGQSGAEEIHYDFLKGEAGIKPTPDAQAMVGDKTMTWKAHKAPTFFVDFREAFDPMGGEYTAGYAVAYVHSEEAMDVTLAVGTNDQGKVWLNGKEVLIFEETRVLDKDADRVPVSLVKGQNILVLKVINEVNSWQACARFLRGETPVTNLRIALAPQ